MAELEGHKKGERRGGGGCAPRNALTKLSCQLIGRYFHIFLSFIVYLWSTSEGLRQKIIPWRVSVIKIAGLQGCLTINFISLTVIRVIYPCGLPVIISLRFNLWLLVVI